LYCIFETNFPSHLYLQITGSRVGGQKLLFGDQLLFSVVWNCLEGIGGIAETLGS